MKRAGIYFFYDKQGVVDRYNDVLLLEMKKSIEYLIVVVNGKINASDKERLQGIVDKVVVRENVGFDVYAYKCGLETIGWDNLNKYDEVVMFNFTIYGPLNSFEEMFQEMEERSLDFWGITKHYGYDTDPYAKCEYGYIPEHIQSSFIVVRKSLISSKEFKEYWTNMREIKNYSDAICYHEAIFTKHFSEKGYSSDVYVSTDDLKDYTEYPLMLCPTYLVQERKCPIIKRKTFYNYYDEWLSVCCGQIGYELMEYIKKTKCYDIDLIWSNLLRTCNMYDLKERMQLNYILSNFQRVEEKKENKSCKVALFMHIYFEDRIEYCKNYAKSMPLGTDIYISTNTIEKKESIEKSFLGLQGYNTKAFVIENKGRDVSALLIGMRPYVDKYDYVCFVHDKKALQSKPYSIGEAFAYHCFENTLSTPEYVDNIIDLFQRNKQLGMLVPPVPKHGPYDIVLGNEWGDNFNNVVKYAEKWNINVDIDKNKPAVAPYGTCFWFRSKAMKKAFEIELKYDDFPLEPTKQNDGNIMHAIERMYPFFVQEEGYYVGTVLSDVFAKLELTNLTKMYRDYNTVAFNRYGVISRKTLLKCIENNSRIGFKVIIRSMIGNKLYVQLWKIKEKLKNR